MFPAFKPYIRSEDTLWTRLRPYITGAAQVREKTVRQALPPEIQSQSPSIEPIHREELLTIPFRIGNDYIAKVVTSRSLRLHNLYVRNINLRARLYGLPPFLNGFLTPAAAVNYRYNALQQSFQQGAFVPRPLTAELNRLNAVLVTKYIPATRSLEPAGSVYDAFLSGLETLRELHMTGHIHGDVFQHTFISKQSRTVFITDPIGRTTPNKRHAAQAYDIASLLARFAPSTGSWSVTPATVDQLPDEVVEYMSGAAQLVAAADPNAKNWVSNDIQEYVDTDSNADTDTDTDTNTETDAKS